MIGLRAHGIRLRRLRLHSGDRTYDVDFRAPDDAPRPLSVLAGAFSMAVGEYVSMQSQRELFERQIALERAELEAMPEEEEAELAAAYRTKGFTEDEAVTIAHRIFEDPKVALDMLVREELGLAKDDDDELDGILRQGYRGSLYSFGYPACPELADRATLVRLLEPERIGVELSEELQLHPEQSTDAIVVHHPEAKYFAAR